MLHTEIIGVCSQIHTKHINTVCRIFLELKVVVNKVTTRLQRGKQKKKNSPRLLRDVYNS